MTLYIILTLVAGALVGYLLAAARYSGKLSGATTRVKLLAEQMEELKEQHEKEINGRLESIKNELKNASMEELQNRTNQLRDDNKQQLGDIINPLQDKIKQMQEAVENSQKTQIDTTSSLREAVKNALQQTERLGDTTNTLVNALSHDNKYQGGFGEMQLRSLLEDFGFERGKHYEEQVTIHDDKGTAVTHQETGSKMRPDVVIHFPDGRDIIIDAKTSMTSFMKYNDTSLTPEQHEQALKDHIAAINKQVKNLSDKEYWRYYNDNITGRSTLDFVVMFIPSEGAMQLALTNDAELWRDAYDKKVFITGPQNLFALLNLLHLSWKQQTQIENQQEVFKYAEEIVERVQLFRERYDGLKKILTEDIRKHFKKLDNTLSDSGQSIINSANKLIKCGAKENMKHKSIMKKDEPPMLEEIFYPDDDEMECFE